ncbi:hypothetical protein HHI36_020323 [Cryptolaemus montrouzieri]|uniref:Uncharacterized protein n=1 Tax=Cryptolaemus montrouzieri TaxID=559131 RepID=A0ABD2NAB4_9CUCU
MAKYFILMNLAEAASGVHGRTGGTHREISLVSKEGGSKEKAEYLLVAKSFILLDLEEATIRSLGYIATMGVGVHHGYAGRDNGHHGCCVPHAQGYNCGKIRRRRKMEVG